MVLARIVEPTSKAEVVRVLDEIGAPAVSLRTLFRSLARSQARDYRGQLSAAAWAHSVRTSGTAALVLYDVTTLHFERGDEDELRKVGMSKEHRVDPQVQVGLLVDPGGFPLEVHPFEGNKAETTTLIPVLSAFAQRVGADNPVAGADLASYAGRGMVRLDIWLRANLHVRHCQYSCHCDSPTCRCCACSAGSPCLPGPTAPGRRDPDSAPPDRRPSAPGQDAEAVLGRPGRS